MLDKIYVGLARLSERFIHLNSHHYSHAGYEIYRWLAKNQRTTADALEIVAKHDTSLEARKLLCSHPNAPYWYLLQELYPPETYVQDENILLNIAKRKDLTNELIEGLFVNSSPYSRSITYKPILPTLAQNLYLSLEQYMIIYHKAELESSGHRWIIMNRLNDNLTFVTKTLAAYESALATNGIENLPKEWIEEIVGVPERFLELVPYKENLYPDIDINADYKTSSNLINHLKQKYALQANYYMYANNQQELQN